MENNFITSDLQVSAFLFAKGCSFISVQPNPIKPQIKQFVFPPVAVGLANLYKANGEVSALKLFSAYHSLRLMILPPKGGVVHV